MVEIDLNATNRERAVFGDDASVFNPNRELQPGVWRWGLSFGLGMHACIGQDLAAGMDSLDGAKSDDHLYGLVPVAVRAVLAAQGRPDPNNPAQIDPKNTRNYWGTYPVVFQR